MARKQETYGRTSSIHLQLLRKATLPPRRVRGRGLPVRPSNLRRSGCSCLKRRVGGMKTRVIYPTNRAHSILSPLCHPPSRAGPATPLSPQLHLFDFCNPKRATYHPHHLRSAPSFPLLRNSAPFLHLPSQARCLPHQRHLLSPHLPETPHLLHLERH